MDFEPEAESRERRRAVPERFCKFALALERGGGGDDYRVRLVDSPVGTRPPQVVALPDAPPPSGSRSSERLRGDRDVRRQEAADDALRAEGERLFRAVFVGELANAFRTSLERVRAAGEGLLVQLHFDEAPETAALPWEALWDPEQHTFLANLSDIPIARGLSVSPEAPTVAPAAPPLRILALLPEPHDHRQLSGNEEWRQIRRHLGDLIEDGQVHVERVEPPTLTALGQRIHDAGCDVLHVVAHGGAGGGRRAGSLLLENAAGEPDEITGAELTLALERRQPPRLVMLSACHGASCAEDDVFDGLAQLLLARGVPAVVAMRTAISDAAAVEFASCLYRQLAAGRTAEAAVLEARRELGLSDRRTEWATPVLYLRGSNVRLFATELLAVIGEPEPPAWRRRLGLAALAALALLAAFFGLRSGPDEGAGGPGTEDAAVDERSGRSLAEWLPPGSQHSASDDLVSNASRSLVGGAAGGPSAPDAERCPSPLGLQDVGLQDLELVFVPSGVLNVDEDLTLVVESPFCIATRELTRRDWIAIVGESSWPQDEPLDWPANDLNFEQARDVAARLGALEASADYRLPTEVEWEYAARARATTRYFFGDDVAELDRYGNCRHSLGADGADGLAAVGSYLPNDWGLYDVHGNVAEWVEWSPGEGVDFSSGVGRKVNEAGDEVAKRLGGSYKNEPENCDFGRGREVLADTPRKGTGLRLVREPDPPSGR